MNITQLKDMTGKLDKQFVYQQKIDLILLTKNLKNLNADSLLRICEIYTNDILANVCTLINEFIKQQQDDNVILMSKMIIVENIDLTAIIDDNWFQHLCKKRKYLILKMLCFIVNFMKIHK